MKIALDFNVSADSAENATTVRVLNALTGIMSGGEAVAPAKPVETKAPAPAKEAVAPAGKAEDVIAKIMVIATRHNKKGKSADIKAIKAKHIDASEKVGEVKDIKVLRAMLADYEAYDKGGDINDIVSGAEQEEEF